MPTRPDPQITCREAKNGVRPGDDRRERGLAGHQVVLVGAVATRPCRRRCSCRAAAAARPARWRVRVAAASITRSPALSQITASQRVGDLGRGELGVGVVDVEPGAVGEDHVGRADLVGVDHRRRAA